MRGSPQAAWREPGSAYRCRPRPAVSTLTRQTGRPPIGTRRCLDTRPPSSAPKPFDSSLDRVAERRRSAWHQVLAACLPRTRVDMRLECASAPARAARPDASRPQRRGERPVPRAPARGHPAKSTACDRPTRANPLEARRPSAQPGSRARIEAGCCPPHDPMTEPSVSAASLPELPPTSDHD